MVSLSGQSNKSYYRTRDRTYAENRIKSDIKRRDVLKRTSRVLSTELPFKRKDLVNLIERVEKDFSQMSFDRVYENGIQSKDRTRQDNEYQRMGEAYKGFILGQLSQAKREAYDGSVVNQTHHRNTQDPVSHSQEILRAVYELTRNPAVQNSGEDGPQERDLAEEDTAEGSESNEIFSESAPMRERGGD